MNGRYLLLISEKGTGFTVNTLCETLIKNDIEVKNVALSDDVLLDYMDNAFAIMFADTYDNSFKMNAIKKKCYDLNIKVMIYGNPDIISTLKRTFLDNMIFKEFVRPVEPEEIVNSISELIKKIEKQSVMRNILVVDDDGVMLRTIMGWLEGRYTVNLANSAKNAVFAIDKCVPDLILLDYEMPVCSGAQFMELLASQEKTKNIPVIFLTSRCDEQTVKEVMALKPKGYILKTTPQDQLLKKLEDFFDTVE